MRVVTWPGEGLCLRGVRREVFQIRGSVLNVRCSAFSSVCQVAPRHVEKPVQRPLPHRQLRFPQPPPLLHLRHEQPRRSHRCPLPRPLAKTEIFHDGQPIGAPLQILEPDLGQDLCPVGKPDPRSRS